MSLLSRTRTHAHLCQDCGAHEPVQDGNRCAECVNRLLRETRPAVLRSEAAWVQRARAHELPPKVVAA